MALARELGVLDRPNVTVSGFASADDKLLGLVHEEPYIAAVKHAGATGLPDPRYGLGTADNPVFLGMHEASALVTGASVAAAGRSGRDAPSMPRTSPAACTTR